MAIIIMKMMMMMMVTMLLLMMMLLTNRQRIKMKMSSEFEVALPHKLLTLLVG